LWSHAKLCLALVMPYALPKTTVGVKVPKSRTKTLTHRPLALLSPIKEEVSVVPEAAEVIESCIELAVGTDTLAYLSIAWQKPRFASFP
jgi:hypothetical protein